MQNYIVREHPIRIMQKCRAHSKGTLFSFLLGLCILYAFLNWIPELLSTHFTVTNIDLMRKYMDLDQQIARQLPATTMVQILYTFLFTGVFKLSECLYTLTYIRNRKVEYRALQEGFSLYLKALGLFLLEVIFISLWSMLFVIPGLIAYFSYTQAFYILAEDPSKSIREILMESKMRMQGNKWNYFRLMVYYLPYVIVAYMPMILLVDLSYSLSLTGLAFAVVGMISEIPVFFAEGYMCLGKCTFYELLLNGKFANFKYENQQAFREDEKRD